MPKCPAGQRAIVTCEVCPTGYYTQNAGFWETCVPCGEGRTTVPDMPHKCVSKYNKKHKGLKKKVERDYHGVDKTTHSVKHYAHINYVV